MKQQYQYMQGSKRVDSRCICRYILYKFNFPWFQRGSINSSSGKDGVQLFTGGGGYPGA